MSRIRAILADDHTIVRKGLLALLAESGSIEVVAEAEDGREIPDLVDQYQPDVIIMDISMPYLNGIEATRRIRSDNPEIKVVILTMHSDEAYVLECLNAGAHAYVMKQSAPKDLVSAIQQALDDQIYISSELGGNDLDDLIKRSNFTSQRDRYALLTRREREVLQLIAEGNDVGSIGQMLAISEKTVRAHRGHVMDKLRLYNTASLTRYAILKGIVSLEK
jgi:two-component system response regulator NreC